MTDNQPIDIIIVKVGTSTLTRGKQQINIAVVQDLARQIIALRHVGDKLPPRGVILVSSAAIAMGRQLTQLKPGFGSPAGESLISKQMLAAIGQPQLFELYRQAFANQGGVLPAQALLTYTDFQTPVSRQNARNTLIGLVSRGMVPVINENDVVATEEITFGDNDRLSALVAELVGASQLIILSDIDGLYTANPHSDPSARLLEEVTEVTDDILAMAGDSVSGLGTGGMSSKVLAARLATEAGIPTLLINGEQPDCLLRAVNGEKMGTRFLPRREQMLSGQK